MKSRLKGKQVHMWLKDQTIISSGFTLTNIHLNNYMVSILECESTAEVYFVNFTQDKMKKKQERCRS